MTLPALPLGTRFRGEPLAARLLRRILWRLEDFTEAGWRLHARLRRRGWR